MTTRQSETWLIFLCGLLIGFTLGMTFSAVRIKQAYADCPTIRAATDNLGSRWTVTVQHKR